MDDQKAFSRFVRTAFHQRRKTLLNNLKESYSLDLVDSNTLTLRAEALSINDFFKLFQQLNPLP